LKRLASILFLVVILFQSFSSLYVLGAFYLNRTYISENICVNRFDAVAVCKGKCYLAQELNQQEKQQQKFPDLKQNEINLYLQDHVTADSFSHTRFVLSVLFVTEKNHHSNRSLSSVFHPPRFA
jgi:hypothetical protein